jgi:hypothetical protein
MRCRTAVGRHQTGPAFAVLQMNRPSVAFPQELVYLISASFFRERLAKP